MYQTARNKLNVRIKFSPSGDVGLSLPGWLEIPRNWFRPDLALRFVDQGQRSNELIPGVEKEGRFGAISSAAAFLLSVPSM